MGIRNYVGNLSKAFMGKHIGPVRTDIAAAPDPYSGSDPWLSGGKPIAPKEPMGTPPRRFQYLPGFNIQMSPRGGDAISFVQLRALGDYTIIRLVIEHVKESLKVHEWDIVLDEDAGPMAAEGDIKAVKTFFESPDKDLEWDEWLGQLIEEVLVVDALSIYRHRTYGGELHALEIIDGGTIKVLTDVRGLTPKPPFPAYQQFLYGLPRSWYTKDEMIYAPRNRRSNKFYGYSPVEQSIIKINEGMRREFYNLAQFTDGNTPAGVGSMPEDWSLEDIKAFQEYFDAALSGQAQARSKIRFVPHDFNLQKFHDDEVFGLFNKYDEWMARIFCFALGISPMPFISMANRAVAQEMGDVEAEGGVGSLKMFIERLINRIIDRDIRKPWLRFNWITDRSRLQEKRVRRNTEYVKSAVFTPNEVREDEGKDAMPGGDDLYFNGTVLGAPQPMGPGGGFGAAAPASQGGAPARPVMPDGSRPVIESAAVDELAKWQRWAEKRLDEGKALTGFSAPSVPAWLVSSVQSGLSKARTKDRVRFIMDTARARVKAVRLEPASPGEAAHFTGGLTSALRDVLVREAERAAESAGSKMVKQEDDEMRLPTKQDMEKFASPSQVVMHKHEPMQMAPIYFSPTILVEKQTLPKIEFNPEIIMPAQPAQMVKIDVQPSPVSVLNRLEMPQGPAPVVNVEAAAPAPVEKREPLKKRYKIIRDSNGDMSGIEVEG